MYPMMRYCCRCVPQAMDEVWVPTQFNKDSFAAAGAYSCAVYIHSSSSCVVYHPIRLNVRTTLGVWIPLCSSKLTLWLPRTLGILPHCFS